MIFTELDLKGSFIIEPQKLEDERGFFARTFCRNEFQDQGLNNDLVQCNISYNRLKGTLRGLHYQLHPYEETKIVQCLHGAIRDIIIDLREKSETYKQWLALELNEDNRRILYIPPGFAHGFQTLQDHTEVFYQMDNYYNPELARGIRWDDPAFHIEWIKSLNPIISSKDKNYEDYEMVSKEK